MYVFKYVLKLYENHIYYEIILYFMMMFYKMDKSSICKTLMNDSESDLSSLFSNYYDVF